MKFDAGSLIGMAIQTVPEPRKVAREIFALRIERTVLWQAFALLVVISTLMGLISSILFPVDPAMYGTVLSDPIRVGVLEAAVLVVGVFAIYSLGRVFGGEGRFDQAIMTVTWVQFVMLLIQGVMFVLLLFAPILAGILWLAGSGIFFWILSHFVAEMHGFKSTGLVFAMILISLMATIFGVSLIFALMGVGSGAMGAI